MKKKFTRPQAFPERRRGRCNTRLQISVVQKCWLIWGNESWNMSANGQPTLPNLRFGAIKFKIVLKNWYAKTLYLMCLHFNNWKFTSPFPPKHFLYRMQACKFQCKNVLHILDQSHKNYKALSGQLKLRHFQNTMLKICWAFLPVASNASRNAIK